MKLLESGIYTHPPIIGAHGVEVKGGRIHAICPESVKCELQVLPSWHHQYDLNRALPSFTSESATRFKPSGREGVVI